MSRWCPCCGGDIDSTAGCGCPRPVLTTTVPTGPVYHIHPAYLPPTEPCIPTTQTDIDWRTRALAAEAEATRLRRVIARLTTAAEALAEEAAKPRPMSREESAALSSLLSAVIEAREL